MKLRLPPTTYPPRIQKGDPKYLIWDPKYLI